MKRAKTVRARKKRAVSTTRRGKTRSIAKRRSDTSSPYIPVTPLNESAIPSGPGTIGGSQPPQERPWLWYAAIGATVLFLILFSVFVFRLMTTIEQQNEHMVVSTRAFRELNIRFVELRNELSRKEDLLRVLSSPRIEVTQLKGFGFKTGARGKLLWDPEKRSAILQVTNLPVVPEGKEYKIWINKEDRMVSAGVFAVTTGGSSFFRVDSLPVIQPPGTSSIAVTLEQKGGVSRPSGALYLTGSARL